MSFSICIDAVYQGVALSEALKDVNSLGYDTVECWMMSSERVQEMAEGLKKYNLTLSSFCPNFFVLNDPAVRERYLESLKQTIENAKLLNCAQLITQVGQDTGEAREVQHAAIVEGLKAAVPLLGEAGITLLVEPLNSVKDHPGYYLTSSSEGFDIIKEVNSPCVKLLYDVYHQLHMGEDVKAEILAHKELIAHFHIAGLPARDERLFEGFDYSDLLRLLQEEFPAAPLGVELFPSSEAARTQLLETIQSNFVKR